MMNEWTPRRDWPRRVLVAAGPDGRFNGSARRTAIVIGLSVAACGLGAVCGRIALSHYGPQAIVILIGVPILVFVALRPLLAVVSLVAVVASVFSYDSLPRVNVPGHPPINLADLLLLAAVAGTLWRRPWTRWPTSVKHYSLALALFLVLASIATIKTALLGYTESRDALYEFRNWLYLGVAVTIAVEFCGTMWRAWLDAAIAVAALLSIVVIAGAASHSVANELLQLDGTQVFSSSRVTAAGGVSVGDLTRIRLDGLYFIYAMLLPALTMAVLVKDRRAWWRRIAVVLSLAAVVLSLNRSMVVAALIGLAITAMLGGAWFRRRLVLISVVAVAIIAVATLGAVAPAVTGPLGNRFSSVLAPTLVQQSASYEDRAYELSLATISIARHPWFGVGPRQFYGAYLATSAGIEVRFFVQNLYVYLATDYGVPAAIVFLLIPGVCLGYGLRRLRHVSDPLDRALLAAGIGTMVALLLSCLADVYVQDPNTTVAFGTACGLLLAASERSRRLISIRT